MTKVELINGIRLDIQKEHEAISLYTEQASKTTDKRAKKVLLDIADEERVHVGELTKLLEILDGECKFMVEGMDEVEKTLKIKPEYYKGHGYHKRVRRKEYRSLSKTK